MIEKNIGTSRYATTATITARYVFMRIKTGQLMNAVLAAKLCT